MHMLRKRLREKLGLVVPMQWTYILQHNPFHIWIVLFVMNKLGNNVIKINIFKRLLHISAMCVILFEDGYSFKIMLNKYE